jgi:hypothetical protein
VAEPPRRAPGQAREILYRLVPDPSAPVARLSLLLSRAAPTAAIDTTVTHLDEQGDVWRTLSVQGREAEVAAARAAFDAYDPPFLVEKSVLGATPRRLILWYKYRPGGVPGLSHTRLAFRLLGRDTVITDHARAGVLTIRILARAGRGLEEFLRQARQSAQPGQGAFELLYVGPPRDPGHARLTPQEQETVRAAREAGYYGVPRRAGVREVAARLGVSASAASYRLRRAEGKLVAAYLEGGG